MPSGSKSIDSEPTYEQTVSFIGNRKNDTQFAESSHCEFSMHVVDQTSSNPDFPIILEASNLSSRVELYNGRVQVYCKDGLSCINEPDGSPSTMTGSNFLFDDPAHVSDAFRRLQTLCDGYHDPKPDDHLFDNKTDK